MTGFVIILASIGITGLFAAGAFALAGRADETTDEVFGDYPALDRLGGVFHDIRASREGQQDHGG